jgi:hypothetical protein
MSISTTLLCSACRARAGRPESFVADKITAQPFSTVLSVFRYLREGFFKSTQEFEFSAAAAMTW